MLKRFLFSLLRNKRISKLIENEAHFAAHRYIAGHKLEGAITAAKTLNGQGYKVTINRLAEGARIGEEAENAARKDTNILEQIQNQQVDANLSVKLSSLGLGINYDYCSQHLEKILEKAIETRNFVWIDMEESAYADRTIKMFRELRSTNLGLC